MEHYVDFMIGEKTLRIDDITIIPRKGEFVSLSEYAKQEPFARAKPFVVKNVSHHFSDDLHNITVILED